MVQIFLNQVLYFTILMQQRQYSNKDNNEICQNPLLALLIKISDKALNL